MRLAVDLGASKVACLIGTADDVRGAAAEPAWKSAADGPRSLQLALAVAEAEAGTSCGVADVALNAADILVETISGESRCAGVADAAAARRALAAALRREASDGVLLHVSPLGYSLDGGPILHDPRGAPGRRLRVEARVVSAPASAILEARERLAEAGLELGRVVAAPYAAGLAALEPEELREGAVVIDLGAARTGVAAFVRGALNWLHVLPTGQDGVTRALAERLGCSEAAAETAKLRHLSLAPDGLRADRVEAGRLAPDGKLESQEIARMALAEAASRAVDALFQACSDALARAPLPQGAERWPVVLVGGGSALPGLRPLAEAALARPVRLGAAREVDPRAAAARGVLIRGAAGPGEAAGSGAGVYANRASAGRPFASALRWLRDNF